MKYMLLIYTDPASRPTDPAAGEQISKDYFSFTQQIIDSGELVSGDALEGTETATSVRVRNGKRSSTDGPFAETKEVLGGYYLVDVKDLDRALELAALIPDAGLGGVVEVRPVADMSAAG
jgi:hypothetical protein